MKKKILVIISTTLLTLGVVTAAYANDTISPNFYYSKTTMMSQDSIDSGSYKNMIDLMRSNGFETAANAMENNDFDAMNDFMENITDDQYDQMIDIMKNNGYESMAKMMEFMDKDEMINMHNSMMGK